MLINDPYGRRCVRGTEPPRLDLAEMALAAQRARERRESHADYIVNGAVRVKKNSLRRIKRGDRVLTVSSAAHEKWANDAQLALQSARHRQPDVNAWGPLNLRALIYLDREPGLTNLDNLIASVMDVLQAAEVIKDDAQIRGFDGSRIRVDRHAPRVEITLTPLESP